MALRKHFKCGNYSKKKMKFYGITIPNYFDSKYYQIHLSVIIIIMEVKKVESKEEMKSFIVFFTSFYSFNWMIMDAIFRGYLKRTSW